MVVDDGSLPGSFVSPACGIDAIQVHARRDVLLLYTQKELVYLREVVINVITVYVCFTVFPSSYQHQACLEGLEPVEDRTLDETLFLKVIKELNHAKHSHR